MAFDRQGAFEQILYAYALFGGPTDDDDASDSGFHVLSDMNEERGLSEGEREARLRDRIVKRIRLGAYDEGDIEWLEIRAAPG